MGGNATRDNDFAGALQDAISARGTTLSALRARLEAHGNPLSLATLSLWRSGSRHPEGPRSLAAIADLEEILGLPTGHLVTKVPTSPRLGPVVPPHGPPEDWQFTRAISETLESLKLAPEQQVRIVSMHVTVDINGRDGHRRERRLLVLQGETAAGQEFRALAIPADASAVIPVFTARAGCHIDRTHTHPSGLGFAAVFRLDVPLRPKEQAMVEYTVDLPAGYPRDEMYCYVSRRRMREVTLWMRFMGEDRPTWAEESATIDGVTVRRMSPLQGNTIHVSRSPFPPGVLELRWGYDDVPGRRL